MKTNQDNALRHDLNRFLEAQDGGAYETALGEIVQGRKRSHWMWFVFPQLRGLGSSPRADFYGIGGLEEAIAYLNHPVLGQRLEEITGAMLALDGKAESILGWPGCLKFRSCMTLFKLVRPDDIFRKALEKFYGGEEDGLTREALGATED